MSGVALVLALLIAVVVIVSLATRLGIAYPILLVVAGGILALVPGLPVVRLDPDLILVLFLPPLVYSTSLGTSRFELKANRRPILALAIGLVLLTMGGVAVVAHLLVPGMGWPIALTLGAVVAPPDPIAASEVAGRVGLPSRLVSILEGEGLINDGTALTAYQLSLAAVGGTVTVLSVGEAAAKAFVFGIGIGLVAGFLATRVLRLVEDPLLENTILLMLPFAAYLPADEVGGSGVLAVLTAGLWYARDGRPILSAAGRLQQRTIWQLVAFLLTGLSFLLVGLELHDIVEGLGDDTTGIPGGVARTVLTFVAVCAAVVVLRFVGVFGYAVIPGGRTRLRPGRSTGADQPDAPDGPGGRGRIPEPRHRIDRPATWRGVTVISWAGMRGAVSLAAALAIPDDIPYRDLVIALTFAVILVTLVGQGLTLPFLVRRLHVVSPEGETEFEMLRARHRLTVAGLRRLGEIGGDVDDRDDVDSESSPQAEALARASALYQRQLDRIEARLADFDDADGGDAEVVPDAGAAQEARDTLDDRAAARAGGGEPPAPAPEDAAAAGIPDAGGPPPSGQAAAVPGVLGGEDEGEGDRASGDRTPGDQASGDQAPDAHADTGSGRGRTPSRDQEAEVRAAFRTYVDDVRGAQRVELEQLERRGAIGHESAEKLRARLDVVELGLPAVPHV